jgi:hypothetical protein
MIIRLDWLPHSDDRPSTRVDLSGVDVAQGERRVPDVTWWPVELNTTRSPRLQHTHAHPRTHHAVMLGMRVRWCEMQRVKVKEISIDVRRLCNFRKSTPAAHSRTHMQWCWRWEYDGVRCRDSEWERKDFATLHFRRCKWKKKYERARRFWLYTSVITRNCNVLRNRDSNIKKW